MQKAGRRNSLGRGVNVCNGSEAGNGADFLKATIAEYSKKQRES